MNIISSNGGGEMSAQTSARGLNGSRYISVSAARKILGCSENTIYRLVESGEVEGYRLNQRGWWKISHTSVMNYLNRRAESN